MGALITGGIWMSVSKGNTTGPEHNKTVPRSIQAGDCVVNEGTDDSPSMQRVDCGDASAEYKVEDDHVFDAECEPGQDRYTVSRRGRAQSTLCLSEIAR